MSILPAWKNVISGGIPPDGSPLYYFSPAPGSDGSSSYAANAGNAATADYATNAGSADTAISASYAITSSHALTASYFDGPTGTAPTVIHAKNTSAQSIPDNVFPPTRVTNWTNTLAQNASEWNAAAGTFTATKAGTYLVSTTLQFGGKGAAVFGMQSSVSIMKNGVIQSRFSNYTETGNIIFRGGLSTTACVFLAIGDILDIGAYQNLGSPNPLTAFDGYCTVSIMEIASAITD